MAALPSALNHAPGAAPSAAPDDGAVAAMAAALIQSRQTILPKRLGAPGPDAAELAAILNAAAHAPDHGQLLPWRFVLVPEAARPPLAEVFAQALLERDPCATPEQCGQAREKAYRAPVLMLVVVDGERGDPGIDLAERLLSAGCAVQNMLLMATAQGHGSALTSGKALKAASLRALFQLAASEQALCFISIGTVLSRKPARARPVASAYVSTLDMDRGVVPGF
ncbi:nitroreductase family protein [Acidovorax sp. JG5]|uniref:nitroreductase family protein n=1 Tax=Acidovorax sp. JG5 TaxID=2822718 RepID=UPI001B32559E|nr:nitroreductase family protein [Acidovorax sp. JG5]MBP3979643.1 nitroreductase family protein [Acidovorax sp. JG5]